MESNDIPVAILAGGLATRLRPITETIPKSLVEVAGKPFLERQLVYLRDQGFRRIVVCLGHLGAKVEERFGDGSALGVHLDYSYDGPVLLGTGGALRKALPLLGPAFVVLYGDSFLPIGYKEVVEAFQQEGRPALMTVFRNEDQWDSSNVLFESDEIRHYNKRARAPGVRHEMRHIDYGMMVFRPCVFDGYPEGALDLAHVLEDLVARRELAGFEVSHRFYEIGSHAGLAELNQLFSS